MEKNTETTMMGVYYNGTYIRAFYFFKRKSCTTPVYPDMPYSIRRPSFTIYVKNPMCPPCRHAWVRRGYEGLFSDLWLFRLSSGEVGQGAWYWGLGPLGLTTGA